MTMLRNMLLLSAACAAPATAATTLTTGTGDGQVSVIVTNQGAFYDATYNPVGTQTAQDAVSSSYIYYRSGGTGSATSLQSDGGFSSTSATTASSSFTAGGYTVALSQTLSSLLDADGTQTGSLLSQAYTFTNTGDATVLDLTRYIDGDLVFGSNSFRDDGGGMLLSNGNQVLFETDRATGANDQASFVGIFGEGGTDGRYDIDQYLDLDSRIARGDALRNQITGDTDGDGFIDAGPGYDVGLALSRRFTIGAGQSITFTTSTIFGTGTPAAAVADVPEPATWGMMILGFGLAGSAMRRRKGTVAVA